MLSTSILPAGTIVMVACIATVALADEDYGAARRALEDQRVRLASLPQDAATLAAARSVVLEALATRFLPAWEGTPWGFYGTSETPGQGEIACGYLVTTVLRDAGFHVQRETLAQQASERIIQTLTPESQIWRFRKRKVGDVLARVRVEGEGLYLLGLDFHVGFLVNRGGTITMCHASYLEPATAICREAAIDPAMESNYHVLGKLLSDPMLRAWLAQKAFPPQK